MNRPVHLIVHRLRFIRGIVFGGNSIFQEFVRIFQFCAICCGLYFSNHYYLWRNRVKMAFSDRLLRLSPPSSSFSKLRAGEFGALLAEKVGFAPVRSISLNYAQKCYANLDYAKILKLREATTLFGEVATS